MGGGWDPRDALAITGPPRSCSGPDRDINCPIGAEATVIWARASGHGDSFTTACPICLPDGYRYAGTEGVWVDGHWVYSSALVSTSERIGLDSALPAVHHFAPPDLIEDLYVAVTIEAARAAYPDTTDAVDGAAALRRFKALPRSRPSEYVKSLRQWRDDVCGTRPFPPPSSIGPHRWVRATREIEWLMTCLECGRSAGPADIDDDPDCPGGSPWPEGWDYTWVVVIGPQGPAWSSPAHVGNRTVITPPAVDLGEIGETPPDSWMPPGRSAAAESPPGAPRT